MFLRCPNRIGLSATIVHSPACSQPVSSMVSPLFPSPRRLHLQHIGYLSQPWPLELIHMYGHSKDLSLHWGRVLKEREYWRCFTTFLCFGGKFGTGKLIELFLISVGSSPNSLAEPTLAYNAFVSRDAKKPAIDIHACLPDGLCSAA